jgi:hypothetical protein
MTPQTQGLRIEWAWALARKERWEEEVEHTQEEMRRFVVSLCYQAREWVARSSARSHLSNDLADGLQAYAYRQAVILARHATNACHIWGASYASSLYLPPAILAILSELDDSPGHATDQRLCDDSDGSDSE